MTNILIISGSPTRVSRTAAVAAFIKNILAEKGTKVEHLSVRELSAEALLHAQFNHSEINKAKKLVEDSAALIVVSPVYKASYPGILKSFFDLIPEKGLAGKTVLSIASGGTLAHLLTLEYAFKPLFSVLGAREIPQGVYIVDAQVSYTGDEIKFVDPQLEERLTSAVLELLEKVVVIN
ncbi:NADPH-dependent FMN reductase [Neobacillus sp. SAB-20_R2A]|uniref:NADPH-dependent FMN reductase n=1 Tax=Neobacillus sp. SAB-20_R2A TaxID=3120519 RepID=UPI003C6E3098